MTKLVSNMVIGVYSNNESRYVHLRSYSSLRSVRARASLVASLIGDAPSVRVAVIRDGVAVHEKTMIVKPKKSRAAPLRERVYREMMRHITAEVEAVTDVRKPKAADELDRFRVELIDTAPKENAVLKEDAIPTEESMADEIVDVAALGDEFPQEPITPALRSREIHYAYPTGSGDNIHLMIRVREATAEALDAIEHWTQGATSILSALLLADNYWDICARLQQVLAVGCVISTRPVLLIAAASYDVTIRVDGRPWTIAASDNYLKTTTDTATGAIVSHDQVYRFRVSLPDGSERVLARRADALHSSLDTLLDMRTVALDNL